MQLVEIMIYKLLTVNQKNEKTIVPVPPVSVDTDLKKWQWSCRTEEALRILHNKIGVWHTSGMTIDQYQELPKLIQKKYPYSPVLSKEYWKHFTDWHHKATITLHSHAESNRTMVFSTKEESEVVSGEKAIAQADWAQVEIDAELLEV